MDPENDAQPTEGFEFPSDITALTPEELEQLDVAAHDEFTRLRELGADATDEDVDAMERLAELSEQIEAEGVRREEEAAARQQRIDAAAERMERPDPDGDEGGEGEDPADDEPAEEEPPAEPSGAEEQPAVAASGRRRQVAGRLPARRNPQPRQPEAARMSIVAAAEVGRNIPSGSVLDGMSAATQAFTQRSSGFPERPAGPNQFIKLPVASIRRNFAADPDGLHVENVGKGKGFNDVQELLRAAADESRLAGGSLAKAVAAAGGWCAPSENLYGMCQYETLDGIIDLPEVGVDRGGINYTPGPDFADIYTSAGFAQTEAEAIAGTTKACVEVDCPDFQEVRLDAVGICVKAPLLTRSAYPELVQRWIEGTVVANQHKVAARLITAMRTALGTALAPTLTLTPVTWSTLTALELIAEGERQRYRMSESETLEVKLPRWVKVAIRADLANRNGQAAQSVTDAQIREHFTDRGLAVQFVLNYLELDTSGGPVAFPATFEAMMYPAGTFVKGTADVINLDTVYDTADLQTNVYTAAFVEDGVLIAKMCHGGRRVTIPVHVTGQMGAHDIDQTWGTAQVNADS